MNAGWGSNQVSRNTGNTADVQQEVAELFQTKVDCWTGSTLCAAAWEELELSRSNPRSPSPSSHLHLHIFVHRSHSFSERESRKTQRSKVAVKPSHQNVQASTQLVLRETQTRTLRKGGRMVEGKPGFDATRGTPKPRRMSLCGSCPLSLRGRIGLVSRHVCKAGSCCPLAPSWRHRTRGAEQGISQ